MVLRLKTVEITEGKTEDDKALREVKNAILKNPRVRYLTSCILQDDGAWKPFKELVQAIKDSHHYITSVFYEDDPHYQNGYAWKDGNIVGKNRIITVETDYGDLRGAIRCYAAGTVEDPLASYDMTIQIF